MFCPTVRHRWWNVGVEPVKWIPARSGAASTTSLTARPSPVSRLMTPSGIPASRSSCIVSTAASVCVGEAFQMTVLPIRAGAVGRLPAIAVKLNGVIA